MIGLRVRANGYFLEGLLELANLANRAARRAAFRESLVLLVQALSRRGPGPLEGVDPTALLPSTRAAMGDGLFDDLDWLAPESAAVALYEIAAALPMGPEKREVGRRVAVYTYDGRADTFAAVATRMALGSGKGLGGLPIRARVALSLSLPVGSGQRIDGLALALASRRELAREWIVKPSRGSLAARRMSSRLVERAASEAFRLSTQGDHDAARAFRGEGLGRATAELLADREPLVWRHAAIARGLLAGPMAETWAEIERSLSPTLTPTEWRRGATSLCTAVVSDPERGSRRVRELALSEVVARDPGVVGCMLWGLSHAAKYEPELAERLTTELVLVHSSAVAEAFEQAAREENSWLCTRACAAIRTELSLSLHLLGARADDGRAALAQELVRDLSPRSSRDPSVRHAVGAALAAFAEQGARQAHELSQGALVLAMSRVELLERQGSESLASGRNRRALLASLRDLDLSLLETSTLANLLALGQRGSDPEPSSPTIEELHERMSQLLIRWESPSDPGSYQSLGDAGELTKLRALLHLLDAEADRGADDDGTARLRERWQTAAHVLAARLSSDPPLALRRSLGAALARALEGLVRAEICEPLDVTLWAAWHFNDDQVFATLGEASRSPDLVLLFGGYATLLRSLALPEPSQGPSARDDVESGASLEARIAAITSFGRTVSGESSSREQALRDAIGELVRALSTLAQATSLADLARLPSSPVCAMSQLEQATVALERLFTSSRRRLADPIDDGAPRSTALPSGEFDRATDRATAGDRSELFAKSSELVRGLADALPKPLAKAIQSVVVRALTLPARLAGRPRAARFSDAPLAAWIPARRTIGGFYIVRPIGTGGLGSVFVAKRVEERNDPNAELFALKVPVYDPRAARQLSEAAFLSMFRSEATALLALPAHPNLARFVTFDLGAKPKPILVMELVDGITLDRILDTGQLTCEQALAFLDGALAGLEAMHSVGVGHLDVKPGNIILRGGEQPVLVDFGLAGRHIRPGCGSGGYGAPEVWGLENQAEPSPPAADVYSAACIGFELLSGVPMFDQRDATAIVAAHVSHDGWPIPMRPWYDSPALRPLGQVFARALRRDFRHRIDARTLRSELAKIAPSIARRPWPLAP